MQVYTKKSTNKGLEENQRMWVMLDAMMMMMMMGHNVSYDNFFTMRKITMVATVIKNKPQHTAQNS